MHGIPLHRAKVWQPVTAALPYTGDSTYPAMRLPTHAGSPRAGSANMVGLWNMLSRVVPPNERDSRGM